MTERKTRKKKIKNKSKKTKKVRGGKSKSLGWEKEVENKSTYYDKETHYNHLCKYLYENEDKKRTYNTHLITIDDPKFKCDDASIAEAISKENDPKKRERLIKIQASKEEFVASINKKIEDILQERAEEAARKAGEEEDLTKLVEGKKAKKNEEQNLNRQLGIASKRAEDQTETGKDNRIKREAEQKAKREEVEKARREAEAEENARREAEEKAKKVAEQKAKAKQKLTNIFKKQNEVTKYNKTKRNLKEANKNAIKQAEEAKQKREEREAEKQNNINNGLFGEYKATNGEKKYFLINPYDLNANCDPKDNNDNENFKDLITFEPLNGYNIIQIGKQCYDIDSFIILLNVKQPDLGLKKGNYINQLKLIPEIDGIIFPEYKPRDITYLTNFIKKLIEKGEDPFAKDNERRQEEERARQEETRRRQAETRRRQEEEVRRRQEEAIMRQEEERARQEEERARQEEARRRQEEEERTRQEEERTRQEEERTRQEEARRRQEEEIMHFNLTQVYNQATSIDQKNKALAKIKSIISTDTTYNVANVRCKKLKPTDLFINYNYTTNFEIVKTKLFNCLTTAYHPDMNNNLNKAIVTAKFQIINNAIKENTEDKDIPITDIFKRLPNGYDITNNIPNNPPFNIVLKKYEDVTKDWPSHVFRGELVSDFEKNKLSENINIMDIINETEINIFYDGDYRYPNQIQGSGYFAYKGVFHLTDNNENNFNLTCKKFSIGNKEYEGDFKFNNGLFSGSGKLEELNSIINKKTFYEGDFINGKFEGKGKWKKEIIYGYETYEGDFINGKFEGKGKWTEDMEDNNKQIFEGEFKNGKKNGKGIITYTKDPNPKAVVYKNDRDITIINQNETRKLANNKTEYVINKAMDNILKKGGKKRKTLKKSK